MQTLNIAASVTFLAILISILSIFLIGKKAHFTQIQPSFSGKFVKYLPLVTVFCVLSTVVIFSVTSAKREKDITVTFNDLKSTLSSNDVIVNNISKESFENGYNSHKDSLKAQLEFIDSLQARIAYLNDRNKLQTKFSGKSSIKSESLTTLMYDASFQKNIVMDNYLKALDMEEVKLLK